MCIRLISLQIPVHADLPVGQNLQDHLYLTLPFFPNVSMSVTMEKLSSIWTLIQWQLFGTGKYCYKVMSIILIDCIQCYFVLVDFIYIGSVAL